MRNFQWIIITFILLISSCTKEEEKFAAPPTDVTDFVVQPKDLPAVFDFVGFAQSSHPVEIRARVEGYLDKIAYQEGKQVKEGDILFLLDPKPFEAEVEKAKGEVARQEAILANAVLTVDRLTPLYEKKAASKKDLDNAIANKLAAEAAVQSAKAQLLVNQINLGYTTIRSPITGLADKAKYREGALMIPGQSSLLTTVSVLDPIWIYFTVSDNDILNATKQQESKNINLPDEKEFDIEALMSDGSTFKYKGKVDFSSPTYDQATGTLLVRAVFPNPAGDLRPGQFVRVKIYGATHPNALYVPQRALMQKKGGMFVYLINKENTAVAQDVSTGDWYGDYQIITNGLKPGDRIVVDGVNKIIPGMPVNVTGTWKEDKSSKE